MLSSPSISSWRSRGVTALFSLDGSLDGGRREGRPVVHWLSAIFGIDVRALAAFRIGLAGILLIDLWNRSYDLVAHYSDAGILPRLARMELYDHGAAQRLWWSLHMASGEVVFQLALFAVAAACALGLLIGYRPRLMSLFSWILLVSLQNRNPMLLQGGDVLLRSLVLWSIFLPTGAVCSVDSAGVASGRGRPVRVLSGGTIALLLQVAFMYFFAACYKNSVYWTSDYSAVHYALSAEHFSKPLGVWLLQFPNLLRLLTWLTVQLEFFGPLLAFCPFFTSRLRLLVVPLFWCFHLSLALTMALGLFSLISVVAWIPFLPTRFWDWLARRLPLPSWPESRVALPRGIPALIGSFLALALITLAGLNSARTVPPPVRDWRVVAWAGNAVFPKCDSILNILRLDQDWQMFAPRPMTEDGWYEFRGELEDGSVVNLWHVGQPLPTTKPSNISAMSGGQRWRKYLVLVREPANIRHLPHFANWLIWRWEREHSEGDPLRMVKDIKILIYVEPTSPPGNPPSKPRTVLLYHWTSPYVVQPPLPDDAAEDKANSDTTIERPMP
ncbi:MAG: HTTM domain-containing protein [Pirellulales bacterium]